MRCRTDNYLQAVIEELKTNQAIDRYDEARTKQGLVLRILSCLGWDIYNIDEVTPEYSVGTTRVDYSLRVESSDKVFIEVKKVGEELESHQRQLLNYSFDAGVKLSILTNGITWWFYLPLYEGIWEQRKFYSIDIHRQDAENVASKFMDFLSRENISSGRAINNAEATHKSQRRKKKIDDALPEAWNQIVSESDELLIDLIGETAEQLCGYKPDIEIITKFFNEHKNRLMISTITPPEPSPRRPRTTRDNFTGKTITAFTFDGTRFEVNTWRALLITLCSNLHEQHRSDFNKVLGLRGRKRTYFAYSSGELIAPLKIEGSRFFVEGNLSANDIVKLCHKVMALFSYSKNDLKIDAN